MNRRLKVYGETAVYHCMSRVVGGQMLLGDREKEVFRKQMWKVAQFSGVEVLTYCLMGNHFHILVKVPHVDFGAIDDEELLRRYEILYPQPTPCQPMGFDEVRALLASGSAYAKKFREDLLYRMHDVSEFMKTLKQRFTIWYNKTYDRYGTFWAERYKSVLVDNSKKSKLIVAAYIDLNPVRAGIVEDPKDYRFSGYGESCGGCEIAKQGLSSIVERDVDDPSLFSEYRMIVFGKGGCPKKGSVVVEGLIDDKVAKRVLQDEQGILSQTEMLRCRIRYFTDGLILGEKDFVEKVYSYNRGFFGEKRSSGARLMKGADFGNLCVVRDLQKDVIG
jgi:REP element-mobilizing transposase RayT